jgi:hypothetical protein
VSTWTVEHAYRRDGRLLEVTETAEVTVLDDRCLVSGRRTVAGLGVRIDVEADLATSPGGTASARLRWRTDAVDVRAGYRLDGGRLTVVRVAGERHERTELDVGSALLSPLLRAAQGPVVQAVAAAREPVPVVVPDVRDPAAVDALLRPLVQARSADLVRLPGGWAATYENRDEDRVYPPGTELLLDERGLLARYELDGVVVELVGAPADGSEEGAA